MSFNNNLDVIFFEENSIVDNVIPGHDYIAI